MFQMKLTLLAAALCALTGCAPFDGRVIYTPETPSQMASGACQQAWDVTPGHPPAHACSFAFADPLSPGKAACRIFYSVSARYPGDIGVELRNCSGVDQVIAHREGRL